MRGEQVKISNRFARGELTDIQQNTCDDSEIVYVPVFTRAHRMGVQLPPTPELVAKHCLRSYDADGQQDDWEVPDWMNRGCITCDEKKASGLSRTEIKGVYKALAAYKKACRQRVGREEIRLDPELHARHKARDRMRKRVKRMEERADM